MTANAYIDTVPHSHPTYVVQMASNKNVHKPKIDTSTKIHNVVALAFAMMRIFTFPHTTDHIIMDSYCVSAVFQWTHRHNPIQHLVAEKILNWYDCGCVRCDVWCVSVRRTVRRFYRTQKLEQKIRRSLGYMVACTIHTCANDNARVVRNSMSLRCALFSDGARSYIDERQWPGAHVSSPQFILIIINSKLYDLKWARVWKYEGAQKDRWQSSAAHTYKEWMRTYTYSLSFSVYQPLPTRYPRI